MPQPETFSASDRASPDAAKLAAEHGITPDQAQRLMDEHGHEKLKEDGILASLVHFLKAPS
jgi:hypothetical protein